MSESADRPGNRDDRVNTVLQAYLEAQDAGRPADRAAWLAAHPDLGQELAAFFETADQLAGCAAWLVPEAGAAVPGASITPAQLAGYEVLGEVGRGGMGVVYKARHAALNRVVALKVLRAPDPAAAARLLAEARAAARLDHPGIVPIFEVREDAGRPVLVMALVTGESLAVRLAAGPVPPREAARLVREAALAVQHAHEQGVVHRDLKPANILVGPDGQPRLTDFGLAKRSGEETLTADGQVLGTPAYMPPEFAAGSAAHAGPAADVYGLGGVLYALLTGQPPFTGDTPLQTLRRVVEDNPVPPRTINPRVDRGLQAVCLKCLEKEPRYRYRSAADLAADLDRYLAGEPPHAEGEGWAGWLGRQFERAVDFGPAREWARLLYALAAVTVLSYALMAVALRGTGRAGPFWGWFLGVNVLTMWGPCLAVAALRRLDAPEREILLFWAGASVGRLVLFANFCPLAGPVNVDEIYRYFPTCLVLDGAMLFAGGRLHWGRLYLFGLADFAAAVVVMQVIALAPILYGAWRAAVLAAIAGHLRRVAAARQRSNDRRGS